MKVTALAPWYGSARLIAPRVGKLLDGCTWVGIPFFGGGCELAHVKARTVVCSDLHGHVINLANVLRHPHLGPMLIRDLRRLPFHEQQLRHAQDHCLRVETRGFAEDPETEGMETAYVDALNYFVCCWMARNATAGTDGEFKAGLSVRWNAGGGDSVVRYRSAVEGLKEWRAILARCTFVCLDVFAFMAKVHDEPGHGLYLDPPFAAGGEKYKHKFSETDHRRLAVELAGFLRCKVVLRHYDHELVRALYPESEWTWHCLEGRTQSNGAAPEVLLTNACAFAEAAHA